MSQFSFSSADLARLMVPTDANVAGNVHGGTIMKMIEEAACVAAKRFFNHAPELQPKTTIVVALSARVESITFQQPLFVGDVAKVHARVVYASDHTVAVSVKVSAERLVAAEQKGREILCNRALLWCVGLIREIQENAGSNSLPSNQNGIATITRSKLHRLPRAKAPPLEQPDKETDKEAYIGYKLASMAYSMRKKQQQEDLAALPDSAVNGSRHGSKNDVVVEDVISGTAALPTPFTPAQSAVELAQVMLPGDCVTGTGLVSGGVVMKLMDNACGIAAVRHCGTNVVTVSVDAMDLVAPVYIGDILRIQAQPTFTSSKSIEIQVIVIAERFELLEQSDGTVVMERNDIITTKQAYFTFVSLPLTAAGTGTGGDPPKSLPMRPLRPETEEDEKRFQQGKARYEQRKALREAGARKQK